MRKNPENIVIISGTNRPDALSPAVARIYAGLLQQEGIEAPVIDLRELPHDYIHSALYDKAGQHEAFNVLRDRMKQADKFVFIIPEYNGSFPGVLKAFIDGLEFPATFRGKKAALVGISAGQMGSVQAMSHFTDILNYCGTHVLARKPRLTAIEQHLSGERLTHQPYLEQLHKQVRELIAF